MMPVQSKDRALALKEICIYANAGPQEVSQLNTLSVAKHSAISLESADGDARKAALFLADKILGKEHEN